MTRDLCCPRYGRATCPYLLEDNLAVDKLLKKLEHPVMEQLWFAAQPQAVGQIQEALAPSWELAYNTVLTVLRRLVDKGLVTQDRVGRAHRYRAVVGRDEFIATVMIDALHQLPGPRCRAATLARLVACLGSAELSAMRRALDEREAKTAETSRNN